MYVLGVLRVVFLFTLTLIQQILLKFVQYSTYTYSNTYIVKIGFFVSAADALWAGARGAGEQHGAQMEPERPLVSRRAR